MVNASIVIPLSLLAISVSIGIFIWMRSNNLGTGDISFIDACYGRYGANDESCVMLAEEDIDWDTKILCHENDDESGTYTMRGFFHAVDDAKQAYTVNGELDVEAATASYLEWFDDECGKGEPLPEGAVDASLTMTKEEWEALPDDEGEEEGGVIPDAEGEEGNVMPNEGDPFVRRLRSLANIEGICSTDPYFMALGSDYDSAECSGRNNKSNSWAYPRCDAFIDNTRYYETKKTLGIGCLNHDACLQKGNGDGETGNCNDNCPSCNPGYQSNLPGGTDCDSVLAYQAAKCAFWGMCSGSNWYEALLVSSAMRSYIYYTPACKWIWTWLGGYPSCWWKKNWKNSPNYDYCGGSPR